jgi:hypothetical protein
MPLERHGAFGGHGTRAAAEPDRLLSAFINGIKRMPCEFSART